MRRPFLLRMRRFLVAALLVAASARADDLRVDYVRRSLTGTHTRYQQFIDGLPVVGGERLEGPLGTRDVLARRGFSHIESEVARAHRGDLVYLNVGGVARLAIREVVTEKLHEKYAHYYDASSGELLRTIPLFFRAVGRVFDVNPVVKLNDPTLQDHNNSPFAVPNSAYSNVELLGLSPSGPLTGPNVQIVDTDPPFTPRADASQSLLFDRSQPQFEEVNAYFQIDRSQRYLQSLGYVGDRHIVAYAIPVDAHALDGADNSYFAEGDVPGQGALYFGDGGTNDAQDADIIIHEYGHAIQTSIAPGAFDGTSDSQARALAEGYSDYWAFSAKYAAALTSGRDPFCLADWDARCWDDTPDQRCGYPVGADCLRRFDSAKTMTDYLALNSSGIEHENGEIWSSALREMRIAMNARYGVDAGRRIADIDVIESMFGTPLNPTYAGQARNMMAADSALNGGANVATICRAMTSRRIFAVGDCGTIPRGERTMFQSATATIHIDDARNIDDVLVRVQSDAQKGSIKLVAPDGTSILLTNNPESDVTYGLDTVSVQPLTALQGKSAAGDWELVVTGAQLRSWSLLIQFAGDQPFATRPMTGLPRRHIPVVGHIIGAASTPFLSDVRIYNRSNLRASIVAIFTPSGADGTTQFAAVRLMIAPQQVMVLDDIVRTTMNTSGLGQLELLGDTDLVMVNSRTYTPNGGSSFSETIPSVSTNEAGAEQIAPLQNTTDFRSNVGVAEVMGGSGIVRFDFLDGRGVPLGSREVQLTPYGHAQFRVPFAGANMRAQTAVSDGNPVVIAYGAVVDNRSGDTSYVAADRANRPSEIVAIPLIHAPGALGTTWKTDVWLTNPTSENVLLPSVYAFGVTPGAVAQLKDAASFFATDFGVRFLPTNGLLVSSRTYTASDHGTFGEFIPALHAPAGSPQEVIGVEQSDRFRTNVGLVNFGSGPTTATVIVYSATGAEVARTNVTVAGFSLQQVPLATIVTSAVTSARIEVRGSVAAYASVIDNITEDPFYIVGQH